MFSILAAAAAATTLSCSDLQTAYVADQITASRIECLDSNCGKRRLAQVQQTVKLFTSDDVAGKDLPALEDEYQVIYETIQLGEKTLEGVNIDLGDNSFIAFFWAGTEDFVDVLSTDGSISAGADFCDVQLEPYIAAERIAKLCEAVVPEVKASAPKSTFTLEACKADGGLDVYVEQHNLTTVAFSVQRNLAEYQAGYFTCTAEMDRTSNQLLAYSCNVRP